MDIGGKLCVVDYLVKNNIEYKYILFLHSKSSFVRRQKYFSFINDKNLQETLIKMSKNYDGIFPNLLIDGDWKTKKWYINKAYTEDLLEYLNCDLNSKKFIEGNCMLLSYRIIKKICNNYDSYTNDNDDIFSDLVGKYDNKSSTNKFISVMENLL